MAYKYYPPGDPATTNRLGDIGIDDTWIRTPIGNMLRDQTKWQIGPSTPVPEKIPTWAIVCSILLFFCVGPFSLLFLLVKEGGGQSTPVRVSDGTREFIADIVTDDAESYEFIHLVAAWAERRPS